MNKLRPILAVVAGYAAWVVGFWVPAIALATVWPAIREPARLAFDEGRYDVFATPMLVSFQFLWVISNGAAGLTTRLVARRRLEVWVLAALLLAYFAYNHLWALWNVMPDWYNVVVVALCVPEVLLGCYLAERLTAARRSNSAPMGEEHA